MRVTLAGVEKRIAVARGRHDDVLRPGLTMVCARVGGLVSRTRRERQQREQS